MIGSQVSFGLQKRTWGRGVVHHPKRPIGEPDLKLWTNMKKRWDTGGRKSVSWLTKMGRKDRSGILASTRSFTGKIHIYGGGSVTVMLLSSPFLYECVSNHVQAGFLCHACRFSYLPGHYILMNYSHLHSVEFERTCSISSEMMVLPAGGGGVELGKTKGMPQTWKWSQGSICMWVCGRKEVGKRGGCLCVGQMFLCAGGGFPAANGRRQKPRDLRTGYDLNDIQK